MACVCFLAKTIIKFTLTLVTVHQLYEPFRQTFPTSTLTPYSVSQSFRRGKRAGARYVNGVLLPIDGGATLTL